MLTVLTGAAYGVTEDAQLPETEQLPSTEQLSPTKSAGSVGSVGSVESVDSEDVGESPASPARFIARKEPVEQLFKALGTEMHKSFRLSIKARPYRVSGEFDLTQPFKVLERVTESLGLIWYYDGQVIYFYDSSESASVMLSIPPGAVDDLIAFLKSATLYDSRFPIKYSRDGNGLVYLSAPPKYIEIVKDAASLLRNHERTVQIGGRQIDVVTLRHAFVSDRTINRRDSQEVVPGLARVLQEVMGSGTIVDTAGSMNRESSALSAQMPGRAPPNEASGTTEIPAMNTFAQQAFSHSPLVNGPADTPFATSRTNDAKMADLPFPMRIVAYASTNSLLLEGTAAQIAMARKIIARLDIPKDQVEVSLWVIDIQKQDADALGARWGAGGKLGPVEVGFNASLLGQGATLSRNQTMRFIASVTALTEQNKARIVSRPILLAQDNSTAVFDNSKSFYVRIQGERIATLQKVTYGTMINVLPHVVDTQGRIEMELAVEDGYSSAPDPDMQLDLPVVSTTSISTTARVQHEQSLLIGGYTLNENTEGSSKIPLLGDLPLVGPLFTYRSNKDTQSIRLFLIQPRLLPEDTGFDSSRINMPSNINDAVEALRAQIGVRHGG